LPDIDGLWVAHKLRTESGPIAKVPILFVGELSDRNIRTQTLNVGADVFLARPISNDEIALQVCALLAMARRLAGEEEAPPSSRSLTAAIRGDLGAFPVASMLMMFELERQSGVLDVVSSSDKRASLTLTEGLFSSTEIAGAPRPAIDVLREVLSWRAGRFSFQPKDSGALPPPRASVGALVLEAMRLEDEENKASEIEFEDFVGAVETPTPDESVIIRAAGSRPPPKPPKAIAE
jgi:hypothetical protein